MAAFLLDDRRPSNQPKMRIRTIAPTAPITMPAIAPAPMPPELDVVLDVELFATPVPVVAASDEVGELVDADVAVNPALEVCWLPLDVLELVLVVEVPVVVDAIRLLEVDVEDVLHVTAWVAICKTVW